MPILYTLYNIEKESYGQTFLILDLRFFFQNWAGEWNLHTQKLISMSKIFKKKVKENLGKSFLHVHDKFYSCYTISVHLVALYLFFAKTKNSNILHLGYIQLIFMLESGSNMWREKNSAL